MNLIARTRIPTFQYSVWRPKSLTKTKVFVGLSLGFSYILYRQGKERYRQMHFSNMYDSLPNTDALTQEYFGEKKVVTSTIWQRLWRFWRRQLRLLHLILKFTPLAFTLPFAYIFRSLYPWWIKYMIYTLQSAGPLWIKLGQWASHRGDIFGEDITRALESLRDSAPPHSAKESHQEFEQAFGKGIREVFEEFDDKPIASGSIAQVHRAKYKGQDVVIKIRHPNIIQNLEMDIKILYKIANFFSNTLKIKSLGMPVTYEEFQKTLVSQTDLRFEGQNLAVFCEKFENNPHIIFPKAISEYVSSNILTESYEEGVGLTTFLNQERSQEHYTAANLGLKAFYKMLIYDNFIHADCHAGNILIRVTDPVIQQGFKQRIQVKLWKLQDFVYEVVERLVESILQKIAQYQLDKNNVKENFATLTVEKKQDEELYTSFIQSFATQKKDVKIIFLDPGMVTILNKSDRAAFIKLVMYVTLRKPFECGQLMLQLAQYNQKDIDQKTKVKFMMEMQDLFTEVCKVPLAKMNIGEVLRQMLHILRQNGMSIEGHFAALLTNMIVLEGLAKQLDPSLNIVAKAASFLIHIRTIDKTIDEIIQQAL